MAANDSTSTSAKQFFRELVSAFLGVRVTGLRGDSILFDGPLGVVLTVPKATLSEGREAAQRAVQYRLSASREALDRVLDAEDVAAVDRFWRAHSIKAVRETNVERAVVEREAA
jgi:hypothetical protein